MKSHGIKSSRSIIASNDNRDLIELGIDGDALSRNFSANGN